MKVIELIGKSKDEFYQIRKTKKLYVCGSFETIKPKTGFTSMFETKSLHEAKEWLEDIETFNNLTERMS